MKIIKILIIIIAISTIILFFKIINKKNTNNLTPQIENEIIANMIESKEKVTTETSKKVEIIKHKNNHGTIEIIIKNNTGKNLKNIIVRAQCYDKEGNNLGRFSGGQSNINTTDNYKITIIADYDTYKYNLNLEYK